jgi:hypothetical protein
MYHLGYLQCWKDIHESQQSQPKSGDGRMQSILSKAKAWAEGYELASKLWGMRHRLAWSLLIAGWWDYLAWLVKFILG